MILYFVWASHWMGILLWIKTFLFQNQIPFHFRCFVKLKQNSKFWQISLQDAVFQWGTTWYDIYYACNRKVKNYCWNLYKRTRRQFIGIQLNRESSSCTLLSIFCFFLLHWNYYFYFGLINNNSSLSTKEISANLNLPKTAVWWTLKTVISRIQFM